MKITIIALQNYWAYKKHFFKLICAFTALIFLLSSFATFSVAITDKYADLKNKTVSSNYSLSYFELEADKISCDFQTEIIKQINIASRSEELFGSKFDIISTYNLALIIDGNTYQNRYSQYISLYSSKEWNMFTNNDYAESGVYSPEKYLLGRFPNAENEIVLSQAFLNCFNVSQDIIGKKIQIVSMRFQDCVVFKDMVVCGIITEEYSKLTGHRNDIYTCFSPSILVSADNSQIDGYEQNNLYITSFSDWLSDSDMEYLTSMKATYVGRDSISKMGYVNNLQTVKKQIALYVGISLLCGLILTIFLLLEKLSSATKKNSAMLLSAGTNNRQLLFINIVQLTIANLTAFLISFPVSIGVFEIINSALSHSLNLKLSISVSLFLKAISICFCCIAALTIIATSYIQIKIKNKQIRDLM